MNKCELLGHFNFRHGDLFANRLFVQKLRSGQMEPKMRREPSGKTGFPCRLFSPFVSQTSVNFTKKAITSQKIKLK